jgi:hypothetical protein
MRFTFTQTIWTMPLGQPDGDAGTRRGADAEEQATVVTGQVRGLHEDGLSLLPAAAPDDHLRGDRATVRLRFPLKQHLVPMPPRRDAVAEERGRLVEAYD